MNRKSDLVRIDPELKQVLKELKEDLEKSRGEPVSMRESSRFLARRIKRKPKNPLDVFS